jgi:hypothetical protein
MLSLAGLAALTCVLVTLALRTRVGLARALTIGLAGTLLSTSALGLVLLDREQLHGESLARGLALALLGALLLVVVARRRWPARAARPWRRIDALGLVLLVVIVGGGSAMRSSPSPYLQGGQDQGIYVNVGHHIARTGRLRAVDRVMAGKLPGLPAELIATAHEIEPLPPDSPLAGVREGRWIAGIHVEDASEGRLVPAFFHLLPVWLAMTELALGFADSTQALLLFAALAQLAVFALGFRLGSGRGDDEHARARGWLVGALAAAGLALHPLDLWISSFPVSENLARACLLGSAALALEAEAAASRDEPEASLLAGLAGLVFALGVFARGSMLALALVLALVLLVERLHARGRVRTWLLVGLVVGSTLATMQAIAHSWPYFFSAATNHFHVPRLTPHIPAALAWAAAGGASVLLAMPLLDRVARSLPGAARFGERVPSHVGWALLGAALLAGLVRLLDPSDAHGPSQQVASVLVRHGGALALGLGLAGVALALARSEGLQRSLATLAAAILLVGALKEGVRYEFYYARYLVADVLPVLVVAAACLIAHAHAWARARWGARKAVSMLALVLLAWWVPPLRALALPVYWTRDLAHDVEDLSTMFAGVPDDAVLMFDSRLPLRWRGYLATPALWSFDRNVLIYPSNRLVERAVGAGTPVYMISGGWEAGDAQRWPNDAGPWHTSVVARGVYRAARAETREGGRPQQLVEWGGPWELQRIDPSIWRSDGKLSLMPGSRFLAHDEPGRLESVELELRWQADAALEWLVEPRALAGCVVSAALVDARGELALTALASTPSRHAFAMPPGPDQRRARLAVRWRCETPRPIAWRRISMRWDAR